MGFVVVVVLVLQEYLLGMMTCAYNPSTEGREDHPQYIMNWKPFLTTKKILGVSSFPLPSSANYKITYFFSFFAMKKQHFSYKSLNNIYCNRYTYYERAIKIYN